MLDVACAIKFGRATDRQRALALLFSIASNRRQAFTPFGVFSDERFHIVEGNDAVVLTLPAPVMRGIEFAASAALPAANRFAIAQFDDGTNARLLIGFRGRPGSERHNSNGASSSDLANHQSTWESNPSQALNGQRGVLTDDAGEHTDAFYSCQGFMEGALLSGARAADEVLSAV